MGGKVGIFERVENGGIEGNEVLTGLHDVLIEGEGAWVVSNFLTNCADVMGENDAVFV